MENKSKIPLKLKENKQLSEKQEKKKKKENIKKPKKEKASQNTSISIPPPQMPTHSLLFLQQMIDGKSDFSLNHVIKLENIPSLMNSIHVPISKMTPTDRLEYLKTMKLEKSMNPIKPSTIKKKTKKIYFNIVQNYKEDKIKFKILTGMSYENFVDLVHLLECQIVSFSGDINVRKCKFQKASTGNIPQLSKKHLLDVESVVFLFIVFIRTGLDFTKLFSFLNLEEVSCYTYRMNETSEDFIERNKSKMSSFIKRNIETFLNRYTNKIQRDFIDQVSSCATLNIPLAVGMTVNDVLICPELLYSYRIIDSKIVQCTTQWINNQDKNGKNVKTKNTDLFSEKVNASGFKYEIQINKLCFITHVVSTFGKTSDINLSKIGDAGTFNFGITIADSGYSQKDYNGIITPLKKNSVHDEEDEKNRNIFNSTITQSRNTIEQVFGNMATLFGILKTNYIQDKSLFQSIIVCICGLYNYYLINGPIRNDLINNKNNKQLLSGINVDSVLKDNYRNLKSKCEVFKNIVIPEQSQQSQQIESQSQTVYSTFGYNKGINQPFNQMEQIWLNSQLNNESNLNPSSDKMKCNSNDIIDVDKINPCLNKRVEIYSSKNGISISLEEMNHLRNGDFISSLIVNYILKKTINNKNIYVFETLEPSFISKINDQTILEMFQEATLYPVWICPVCDNNHFTLFIVHTVHLNSSFQQSCILFFNSLPSFSFDMKNHVDMLKRIANCINCRYENKVYTINVPHQSVNDCGCCVCYFAQRYSNNMPCSVDETIMLFSGEIVKLEMDNERKRMINSIEEDKYFNSQL